MASDEVSRRKAIIQQLHLQPFDFPPQVREYFESISVAFNLLFMPDYESTVVWTRQQGSPNGLFHSTLQTIPHWVNLRTKQRRSIPYQPEISQSKVSDLISLVQLGGTGVCSHPQTLHGGIVSTLFDEVFLATIGHCLNTHPANVDDPLMVSTVQLNVMFLQAVKIPGMVVIRSWCTAISGRKC